MGIASYFLHASLLMLVPEPGGEISLSLPYSVLTGLDLCRLK